MLLNLWGIYRSAEGCMQVNLACMQPEGRSYTVRKGSATVELKNILIVVGSQLIVWGRAKIIQSAAGQCKLLLVID